MMTTEDVHTLASAMIGVVDDMLTWVLVEGDINTASRALAAMDRDAMGCFLGALAYRAVQEAPEHPRFWVVPPDHGRNPGDPGLTAMQMIVAAGNRDNDTLVALCNVLMDRRLVAVGWAVQAIFNAIREAREMRAWGGA